MIKKLLVVVPFIAGASWAGTSWYAGAETQDAYEVLLVQLNESSPFALENESYRSGLAQSVAITRVTDGSGQVLFRLEHSIEHGPVRMQDTGVRVGEVSISTRLLQEGGLSEDARAVLAGFADGEPFTLQTDVGYDGRINQHLVLNPFQAESDGLAVEFEGGYFTALTVNGLIDGAGELGAVRLDDGENRFELAGGRIQSELQKISSMIYTGTASVAFDSAVLDRSASPSPVTLGQIELFSDTRLNDERVDTETTLKLGSVQAPVSLESAQLRVAVNGLSLPGLQNYALIMGPLSLADLETLEPAALQQMVVDAWRPLLQPGTGVEYALDLRNPGGQMLLDLGFGIAAATQSGTVLQDLDRNARLRDVLEHFTLDAQLQADAAAIDQTPLTMLLVQPEAQQFIVSEADGYRADLSVQNLVMKLNGEPLPLEMMLSEWLDKPLAEL